MPISLNEIRSRAMAFTVRWSGERHERAESQTFWNEFFDVFGIDRRRYVVYEKKAKKLNGQDGYIDVFWKGLLLVEQKSLGVPLDRAYEQATGYFPGLQDYELPKYVLVSDFERFRLYNLEANTNVEFGISSFIDHIEHFGFISGYRQYLTEEQDPVNIKAAEAMGKLHDQLKAIGYSGHDLEVYIVRLLFCLFADDASIFNKGQFYEYISVYTREDGSDLAGQIAALFQVLNTPSEKRYSNGDATLNAFPYINGQLFADSLPLPHYDRGMRQTLLNCCALDWGTISPAIFGAMFQSVMDPKKRRAIGAHYTSEKNIMKVIKPLFLDELLDEFEHSKDSFSMLLSLRTKLGSLRFLDPACGCGNFLVLAYREIRLLEMKINLEILKKHSMLEFPDKGRSIIDVDQFYGIEIEEFPAQIAQVALWLMDHQMNMQWGSEIGQYYTRLPLGKKAKIIVGNALRLDWKDVVSPIDLSYMLGNPPFSGARMMSKSQKEDIRNVFRSTNGVGNLDYVSGWYRKSLDYIKGTKVKVGLVSTNSITQGEQVYLLWKPFLEEGIRIIFAHQTFKWSNEAKNVAAVYCIIIGFSVEKSSGKVPLFYYKNPSSEPERVLVDRINPYLCSAPDILVNGRKKPISKSVPEIGIGNMPIDNGQYLFTEEQMLIFINKEPLSSKYFRRWVGADELLNGYERYCLYVDGCSPSELRQMPLTLDRIQAVKAFREASKRTTTRKLASYPTTFGTTNIQEDDYIVIPKVSSEKRDYIPMSILDKGTLASDLLFVVPSKDLFLLGLLMSAVHMAWMRLTGGRLEGRYRYSKEIVYNTFPFIDCNEGEKVTIRELVSQILAFRSIYDNSALASLYNPIIMPKRLKQLHKHLDEYVDRLYGVTQGSDVTRTAVLLNLYSQTTI